MFRFFHFLKGLAAFPSMAHLCFLKILRPLFHLAFLSLKMCKIASDCTRAVAQSDLAATVMMRP